eukprot:scaffold888_cov569-Prasinococcus_capsulatus_cf.AAC.17
MPSPTRSGECQGAQWDRVSEDGPLLYLTRGTRCRPFHPGSANSAHDQCTSSRSLPRAATPLGGTWRRHRGQTGECRAAARGPTATNHLAPVDGGEACKRCRPLPLSHKIPP